MGTDYDKVAAEIGNDPACAPFTRALRRADKLMIVRNTEVDLYTRIWCVWELYIAKTIDLAEPGKLLVAGPNAFADSAQRSVEDAQASEETDKIRICTKIRSVVGMMDEVNAMVDEIRRFDDTLRAETCQEIT